MASDESSMTFLAFPREIRDLIYTHLITKNETYIITSAKTVEAEGGTEPNLGIINACKTTQREVLEMLCPHSTIRFPIPASSTSEKSAFYELAGPLAHVEFYVDFMSFDFAAAGYPKSKTFQVGNEVRGALRKLGWNVARRKSCRIIIRNHLITWASPLLRPPIVDTTLVGLETLVIKLVETASTLWKVETFLRPNFGPSTVYLEKYYSERRPWESFSWEGSYPQTHRCIKFHPSNLVAEVQE